MIDLVLIADSYRPFFMHRRLIPPLVGDKNSFASVNNLHRFIVTIIARFLSLAFQKRAITEVWRVAILMREKTPCLPRAELTNPKIHYTITIPLFQSLETNFPLGQYESTSQKPERRLT